MIIPKDKILNLSKNEKRYWGAGHPTNADRQTSSQNANLVLLTIFSQLSENTNSLLY